MSDDKVYMFIPPAHDWSMPLMALPLLKAYLPKDIECKILDVNVDFFNYIWGRKKLDNYKKRIKDSLKRNDMIATVNTSIELEKNILLKEISDHEYVLSRKVHVLDRWYDSNRVYEFLQYKSKMEKILTVLLNNYSLDDGKVFAISIGVEDQIVPSFILMKILKEKYSEIPIILGGNIVSRLAENIYGSKLKKYFDILIVGEGEESLPLVLKQIINYREKVDGIIRPDLSRVKDKKIWNPKSPIFDDVNWNNYLCPIPIIPISLNRRCSWARCDFCAIHVCWDKRHKERNIDDVIAEISYYIKKFDVNFFRIIDENVSPKLLNEFADKVLEMDFDIYYEMYTRFDKAFWDFQFVHKIYLSGCRQIFWGIENINNQALKFMNKGTDREVIDLTLSNTARAGILNYCFILTGIPEISIESERETIDYVIKNKNIHVAAIGSYVVDKLSPMDLDENIRNKYHITLYTIGDLTTEIGYLYTGIDLSRNVKMRTTDYIKRIYSERPDYALNSLLNEEIRFVLAAKYDNTFIDNYLSSVDGILLNDMEKEAINRAVEERVLRNCEV